MRKIISKLSSKTGLPLDAASGEAYIRIFSDREMLIENAGRIQTFSEELISLKINKNIISVSGKNLDLVFLKSKNLAIRGIIENITFERKQS